MHRERDKQKLLTNGIVMAVMAATTALITDNFSTLCIFGATFITALVLINIRIKSRVILPKGPSTIPLLGNALSLKQNDEFLDQLIGWSKDYGPVYPIYAGSKLLVIVNGSEAIKEVTVKNGLDFGDRPESIPFLSINPRRLGLFDTRADDGWRRQRKFAHSTLRGMGFGKVSLEPVIQRESKSVIKYFQSMQETSFDPRVGFGVTSSNVICSLLFNQRVEHGSEIGKELMANVQDIVFDEGVLMFIFPSLWPVIKHTEKWRKFHSAWGKLLNFFHEQVRIRQERLDASSGDHEINDFVDAYLVQRRTDPENYTLEALDFVLVDLLTAGTDTTSVTLTWAVIYLVNHPDIQQKIHDEIMQEIGCQEVSFSHRSGLQYTQAALLEVQRMATVAPIIPRQATKDSSIIGNPIPRGTELYINFWSLHYDPAVWTDPKRFNPDRFLEADGTVVKQPENFLPFSAGKRVCMGDQLAKMELFLFFTSLVQQVKFSLPPGVSAPSLDGVVDLVRKPVPFEVRVSSWPS